MTAAHSMQRLVKSYLDDAPDPNSWIGQRDRTLLAVLYNTGARVSEISGLRIGDVVLESSPSVHIHGKGRKQRTVPLWRTTAALNVAQRLSIAIKAAARHRPQLTGRHISPHTFRHTTAMHLLQSGVHISVIALWLGHESPSTTHMYIEADLSMKERALQRLTPCTPKMSRYQPPEQILKFLETL